MTPISLVSPCEGRVYNSLGVRRLIYKVGSPLLSLISRRVWASRVCFTLSTTISSSAISALRSAHDVRSTLGLYSFNAAKLACTPMAVSLICRTVGLLICLLFLLAGIVITELGMDLVRVFEAYSRHHPGACYP